MPSFRWGGAAKKAKEAAAIEAAEMKRGMEKEALEIAEQERALLEAEEAAELETLRLRDLAAAEAEAAAEAKVVVGPGRKGWLAVKTVTKSLFGQKTSYENHFFTLYEHTLQIRENTEFINDPIVSLKIDEKATVQLRVVPGIKDPDDTRLLVVDNGLSETVEMLAGTVEDARGWMGALQHFRSNMEVNFKSEAAKDPKTLFMMEAAKLAASFMMEGIDPQQRSVDSAMHENMTDSELVATFPDMAKRRYMEVHFAKAANEDIGVRLVGGGGPGSNPLKPFIFVASCRGNSIGSTADLRKGDIINKVGKRVLKDVTLKEAQRIFDEDSGNITLGVARSRKEPFIRQPYHDDGEPMPEPEPEPEPLKRRSSGAYGFGEDADEGVEADNVDLVDVIVELTREDLSEAWGFEHVKDDEKQLVVTDVTPLSEADGKLEPKDILLSVNGQTAAKMGKTFIILAERLINSRPRLKLIVQRVKTLNAPVAEEVVVEEVEEELDFGASTSAAPVSSGNDETVQKAGEDESFGFGGASPPPSPAPNPMVIAIDDMFGGAEEAEDDDDGVPPPPPDTQYPGSPSKTIISEDTTGDVLSPLPDSDSPEKIARKARLAKMRQSRKVRRSSVVDELASILAWIDNLPDE